MVEIPIWLFWFIIGLASSAVVFAAEEPKSAGARAITRLLNGGLWLALFLIFARGW